MLTVATTFTSGCFALWQTPPKRPPSIQLVPHTLSRLLLPVYGTEHLLLFCSDDADDDRVLPVLLRYREGEQIEHLLPRRKLASGASMAVGVECIARRKLFEAAVGRPLALWDLPGLGEGCTHFWQALIRCLESNSWKLRSIELGAEADGGVSRYREEANVQNREVCRCPRLQLN